MKQKLQSSYCFHGSKLWVSREARVKKAPRLTKHYMTNGCSSQKCRKSFIADQTEQSDPLRLICDSQDRRAHWLLTSLKLMSESSGKSGCASPEPSLVAAPQLSPSLCSPHSAMTHGYGGRSWHRLQNDFPSASLEILPILGVDAIIHHIFWGH